MPSPNDQQRLAGIVVKRLGGRRRAGTSGRMSGSPPRPAAPVGKVFQQPLDLRLAQNCAKRLPVDPTCRQEKVGKQFPTFSPLVLTKDFWAYPDARTQDAHERLAGIVVERAARRGTWDGIWGGRSGFLGMPCGAMGMSMGEFLMAASPSLSAATRTERLDPWLS